MLVHVTVPPTLIEMGLGEYAVVVRFDELATIDTGVPLPPVSGVEGELEPQPMLKIIRPARILNRSLMLFSIRTAYRKRAATWRRR